MLHQLSSSVCRCNRMANTKALVSAKGASVEVGKGDRFVKQNTLTSMRRLDFNLH